MSAVHKSIELSEITPQPTGVAADHVDPNHPYFPHDPEAQSPPRSFQKGCACLCKKWFLIISSLILLLGLIITSLLVGIKISISKCPDEHALVYETTITTSTLSGGTVKVKPEPTTITTTLHTSPGGLIPAATGSFVKAPLGLTPVASPQRTCTSKGSWPTIEECVGKTVSVRGIDWGISVRDLPT